MNLTGLSRAELRSTAEWCADPERQQAARDEIVRRELAGELELRVGRRKMGNDPKVQFD